MSPMMMRFFTLVGIALAAASFQLKARAEPLPAPEVERVRAVVMAQLQAFATDDAEAAFAVAAPSVRQAVGDSTRFLDLVRGNYPMVYRPAGFGFLPPEKEDGQVLQLVSLRDNDGVTWLAVFSLEQQPDMAWRINGCIVAQNTWRAA